MDQTRTPATTLDLSPLGGGGKIAVLSGKDRGLQPRRDYKVDEIDRNEVVEVTLPTGLTAMTPSFVLGMFGRSVQASGSVEAFFRKYRFRAPEHVLDQIRRGAQFALMPGSALSG